MCRKVSLLLILLCAAFAGCSIIGANSFEKVSKKLLKLDSYTCEVTMRVANNKSINEYRLKHYFKSPGKYKIEVIEPKELEGQTTIYNGSSSYIYHPRIDQYLITENFSSSADYNAFVGAFMERLKSTEDLKVSSVKEGDKEFVIVEFAVSKPNRYMEQEKIWFDAENTVPVKAEIYGSDGKTNVQIYYDKFVYNPGLKDGDFEITQKNSMKLQEMKENVRSEENQGCVGGDRPGCTCPQHEGSQEACAEGCACNRSN